MCTQFGLHERLSFLGDHGKGLVYILYLRKASNTYCTYNGFYKWCLNGNFALIQLMYLKNTSSCWLLYIAWARAPAHFVLESCFKCEHPRSVLLSLSHSRTFLGRFLWCIWLGGMRSILDLLGSNLGVDLLWYSWGFPHVLLGCYGALKTHSMSTLGRLRNIPSTLVLFFLYFYVR